LEHAGQLGDGSRHARSFSLLAGLGQVISIERTVWLCSRYHARPHMLPTRTTRVAVIQLAHHPAAILDRGSPLEDPLFDIRERSILGDLHGEGLRDLRASIRAAYCRQLGAKLSAVLRTLASWDVRVVLLPEYSVPAELLPDLLEPAGDMLVFAGTHAVDLPTLRSDLYRNLGWIDQAPPRVGSAIAPVLYRHRLIGLPAKLNPARRESDMLVPGEGWAPLELPKEFGGPAGVLVCLDFLFRESARYREFVGEQLRDCRFLAVPSP
jgi:hypothetical protein